MSKVLVPKPEYHYNDVVMGMMASQITSLTIVYSIVYSGAYQRKHQSSASLAFVWGIHRWPVNSPHKGPVTRKMFPFDDVIMFPSRRNRSDQYRCCLVPFIAKFITMTWYSARWCLKSPVSQFFTSSSSPAFFFFFFFFGGGGGGGEGIHWWPVLTHVLILFKPCW